MKKIILLPLVAVLFSSFNLKKKELLKKKEFIGKITYSIDTYSKKPDIISQNRLASLYGDKMIIYIKKGDILRDYNGLDISKVYILKSTNKEYSKRNHVDSLYVMSLDSSAEKLISMKKRDSVFVIARHPCQSLIIETGNSPTHTFRNTYYYDKDLYVDPSDYKNRKFGYTNLYYETAKAQWLKYVLETENCIITYTAIEIEETDVDDSMFVVPNFPKTHW